MEVKRNQWEAWIYLAPTLILMAVFTVYPLFNTFFIAFAEDYNYMLNEWSGLGFGNFETVLQKKAILLGLGCYLFHIPAPSPPQHTLLPGPSRAQRLSYAGHSNICRVNGRLGEREE